MNNRQLNKYEMLCAIYTLYDKQKEAFTEFNAVAGPFTAIKSFCKEIELNEKIVSEGTKGKVESKNNAQEKIIQTGLVIAGAIYAYAADKNDVELMTFSDLYSKSFTKLREAQVPIEVDKILDKAGELGDLLIPFGLSADKRTSARQTLDEYIDKFANLSSGKTSKKAAGENIAALFDNADKKLKVLDKLMLGVKEKNAELYAMYESAKVIIDKASSRKTTAQTETADTVPSTVK